MNTTAVQAPRWRGWFRPNKRCKWVCLVDGEASYDAAWEKLLAALASMRGGESLVTTADPNADDGKIRRRCF